MTTTSCASSRGRAFAIAIALAVSIALLAAPGAGAAVSGDPIATSTVKFKLSKSFKKQLKRNGVKMKPKKLVLGGGQSDVDPTTGKADLRFKKITFKKGNKKVVYGQLKGSLPGTLKGTSGKLFKLTKANTTRDGFGADLNGIKVKFLKSAAKKINKKLGLHSLKPGSIAKLSISYQPETVQVISGTATTTGASTPSPALAQPGPYPVAVKLGFGHCVSGNTGGATGQAGIQPIAPATQPGGPGTTISFPITGGTIGPNADSGNVQQAGGVRIIKNLVTNGGGTFGDCTNGTGTPGGGFGGQLDQTNQTTRLGEKDVQSTVNVAAAPPSFAPTGNLGTVIGQTLDTTNTVVTADPANKTISTTGTLVKLTATSATSLNGIFPCVNTTPCSSASSPNTAVFNTGDLFGSSTLTVTVR